MLVTGVMSDDAWEPRQLTVSKSMGIAFLVLSLLTLSFALSACGQEQPEPEIDTQATVVAAVQATVQALPSPAAQALVATSTPVVIIATPESASVPIPALAPMVTSASASISEKNSLIAMIDVELDAEANVYVEYENVDAGRFRTVTTERASTSHVVPVLRLRPESLYTFEAFAVDSDGETSEPMRGTFMTGALPEALATLEFKAQGNPTSELALLDHRDVEQGYIFLMDQDSNIVWYYASPNPVAGTPYGVQTIRQKPNFNLVYYLGNPTQPCCLREITPLGEIVDSLSYSDFDGVPHHDHLILPDNKVLYLAWTHRTIDDTANGGDPETIVEGESLRIWDQNTGTTEEIWNSFDAFSTDVRLAWTPNPIARIPGQPSLNENLQPIRWTFANSLDIGPAGSYIVSLKRLFQVIFISPDLETIQWTVGGPNTDFRFDDPTDRPYNFHTVTQLLNGNLLIFDNGLARPEEEGGEYTRVMELELDDYDLVASKVWEYRPEPDVYARLRGSAWRLENGNTFINFDMNPRLLVEVARDGTEIWKLEVSGPRLVASYRAYPLSSISGETRLP